MDVDAIFVTIERLETHGVKRREADRAADALAGELRRLLIEERGSREFRSGSQVSDVGPLQVELRDGASGDELGVLTARAIAGGLWE